MAEWDEPPLFRVSACECERALRGPGFALGLIVGAGPVPPGRATTSWESGSDVILYI